MHYLDGQMSLWASGLTRALPGSSLSSQADGQSHPASFSAERRRTVTTKSLCSPGCQSPGRARSRSQTPDLTGMCCSRELPNKPVMEKHEGNVSSSQTLLLLLLPDSPSSPELNTGSRLRNPIRAVKTPDPQIPLHRFGERTKLSH